MSSSSKGRVRPRPVSFGNPALGTYGGVVFTVEHDESDALISLPAGAKTIEKVVAMIDVPPEQVPEGVLNLARSHRPFIEHLKIMVSSPSDVESSMESSSLTPISQKQQQQHETEMEALSLQDNDSVMHQKACKDSRVPPSPSASAMESAASILALDKDDDDFCLTTETRVRQEMQTRKEDDDRPSRTYVILFQLSTQEAADTFVTDLHDVPFTSLDETERCSVYHVAALQEEEGVSLMSPFFAPSASDLGLVSTDSNNNSSPHHALALEVHNCAVCLERMNLEEESLLTTVCNHSFHLDCLLQWQDSPCPVCRYDHSGLDEALSRCHICGATESNYVCLICGVVSCGGSSADRASAHSAAAGGDASTLCQAAASPDNNTTTTMDGTPPLSHARQHYDDTLHAYALETETQHVWDFCGQGYVHRLLLAKDGKLVEVNDPNSTSHERSLSPGLSDAQEVQVVHRKLEGFASQYYTLLKSQLEQQRIYYESRLEEIRREYGPRGRHPRKKSASPSADLILALKQERNQLMQRCNTLRQRYKKVSDDVSFLKNMNESLEANKAPTKRKIMESQRQRAEARDMLQKCLPPLEEKVTKLMLQLEESMNDAHVEQAPGDGEKKPAAKKK